MKLIKTSRIVAFCLASAIMLALIVATLYELQIVEGAAYYEESQNSITTSTVVTAARGNILDRYGREMVTNRECYNLKINTTKLFSDEVEDPNAVILEMVRIVEAAGCEYTDDLPITTEPPYEYKEDMTALQRTMLYAYFDDKDLDYDTTAVELMSYFRTRYDISNTATSEEMRIISSIRYALNVRYAIATDEYVFVEDASNDLISDLMGAVGNIIEVETSFIREYNTQYAAHILGYVGSMNSTQLEEYMRGENSGYSLNDKVGQDGVELAFEDWLHGVNGEADVESTADGTVVSTVYTKDPEPGNHVYLTIDLQLQESVERALELGIYELQITRDEENRENIENGDPEEEDVGGGAIVVVDVDTGEPLAIASYPTFSLETMLDDYDELVEDESTPLFNRALNGTYAPGSTFKPLVAIAGLSEGIVNTETQIVCNGVYTKYAEQGYAPVCWIYTSTDGEITHGAENVVEAIKDSCNIYFYTLADSLGIRLLDEYAEDFGLGESTGIELSEALGNMASPETHNDVDGSGFTYGDTVQAGIGQSDSLFTPLQIAEYCAAIANGGTRHSASILKGVRSYDYSTNLFARENEVLSTVESEEYNYSAVQRGMYLLTHDVNGSSSALYYLFNNYSYGGTSIGVAAKTGTAQLGENRVNNGIIMCYAPFDDPEIAICIVVEHARSGASLGNIAKDVLDAYFSIQAGAASSTAENENALLK